MAWFTCEEDRLILKGGSLGAEPLSGEYPLLATGRGRSAAEACRRAWGQALEPLTAKTTQPEPLGDHLWSIPLKAGEVAIIRYSS